MAGWVAPVHPASNGAASATLAAFEGFAWLIWPLLPLLAEPGGDHGEIYVLNEGLGTLVAFGVAFGVVLPFLALAGYLGGKTGGRLRDVSRQRPQRAVERSRM